MSPKHTIDLRHLIRSCSECGRRFSPDAVFCPFDGARLEDTTAPDEHLDPVVGQTIDARYAIESVIGEGGMGTVYRAKHVTLGRALAIKVLRSDLAQEADLAARFLQEAQATAAIKHPNVVSISDFGRLADARPYFVMELLAGRTLAALIKAGGALPPGDAARIALAVTEGLEAAHTAGVVHRDMKPENIFLVAGNAHSEIRIVDFGAAMMAGATRLTKAGIVFGTPHYMSPEQAAGKTVDHRADIYALGVILYEMITGRVPFEGDTYMGVLTQHMFVAPRPLTEVVPALSGKLGALEGVVLRALEKDPTQRFASMLELGDAIRGAMREHGATPSWPPPSSRPSSTRAHAPKGIADDLELPTMGEIRDRMSEHGELERRSRAKTIVIAVVACCALLIAAGIAVRVYSATTQTATSPSTTVSASPIPTSPSATVIVSAAVPPPIISATATPSTTVSAAPSAPHVRPTPTHAPTSPTSHGLDLGPDPFAR